MSRALRVFENRSDQDRARAETAIGASDGAVQILSILQRDARLVDFLMEDISGYSDEQVGAAVRDVQQQSRQSMERYLRLQPVIDGVERHLHENQRPGSVVGETDRQRARKRKGAGRNAASQGMAGGEGGIAVGAAGYDARACRNRSRVTASGGLGRRSE